MASSCDECDESDVIPKRRSDAEQGAEETTYCCCCTFAKDFGKPGKNIGCSKKNNFLPTWFMAAVKMLKLLSF